MNHAKQRNEWFYRGRVVRGLPSAELRRRAVRVFNPSTPVTPGSSAVDVVMNITTRARNARKQAPLRPNIPPRALGLFLLVMLGSIAVWGKPSKRMRYSVGTAGISLGMILLLSCAGVSNGGDGGGQPPPPITYHITVIGTSAGTPIDAGQSTTVALVVN